MNAVTVDSSAVRQEDLDRPRLLGLGNLVRKDLAEWVHGKRPWVVARNHDLRLRPSGCQLPDHRVGGPVLPDRAR